MEYENTTRDQYLRLCERFHKDIVPFAKAEGGAVFNAKSMTDSSVDREYKILKQPFNPIELE